MLDFEEKNLSSCFAYETTYLIEPGISSLEILYKNQCLSNLFLDFIYMLPSGEFAIIFVY